MTIKCQPPRLYASDERFDLVCGAVTVLNADMYLIRSRRYLPKNRGPFHLRSGKQANSYSDGMAQVIPQGTTRRFKVRRRRAAST